MDWEPSGKCIIMLTKVGLLSSRPRIWWICMKCLMDWRKKSRRLMMRSIRSRIATLVWLWPFYIRDVTGEVMSWILWMRNFKMVLSTRTSRLIQIMLPRVLWLGRNTWIRWINMEMFGVRELVRSYSVMRRFYWRMRRPRMSWAVLLMRSMVIWTRSASV